MKIALFISRKNQLSVDCCIEIINLLGADNDISIDQAYKSYFSEDILSKVSFFDSSKKIETNHVNRTENLSTTIRSEIRESNIIRPMRTHIDTCRSSTVGGRSVGK